jgi:hypothetical protein
MTPAAGPGILNSIENNAVAAAMRGDLWLYPIVEIVHISGFVILVGAIVMFDLRLLGLSRALPVRLLARHLLPWSLAALVVIVPSGLMMFSAHASDFIANPVFLLKLTLLTLAATNATAFHVGVFRSVENWNIDAPIPATAKLHAIASLAFWFSIISCGRLLAYV